MSVLFEKTSIKGMELNNRLVRSATHEGMADQYGFPTQDLFRLYERLTKGGVGLIITGYAFVTPDGKGPFAGMQGIHTDDHISRYRKLVQSVHEHGARIAMQIAHCGRQTTREAIGTEPIGPSVVKEKSLFVKPREMNEEDIERIIEAFAQAARRVKESGFDAVQIHVAHGYLINQFLCPHTNRRKDRWGGSLENRMRFVQEIYARCRKQVGDDFSILVKINGTDNLKDGLKIEESAIMAQMMGEMGFDGIEVSCGIMEDGYSLLRGNVPIEAILNEWPMYKSKDPLFRFIMKKFGRKIIKPPPMIQAYNRESARVIKNKVNVPVFLVGGITDPASMEEIIEKGDADYISLCRALIADPAFPEKIRSGSRESSKCIHCNLCGAYMISRPLKCYYGKMISEEPS
jgi:2,4-dienoyl-CoA reductase-like NADH-dependent reductase (Old Yellow Enzyme family)